MITCKASLSAFAAASSAELRARCFCGSAVTDEADVLRKWLSAPAGTNNFVPSGSSLSATSSGPKMPALIATTAKQQEYSHSNEHVRRRCITAQCELRRRWQDQGGRWIECVSRTIFNVLNLELLGDARHSPICCLNLVVPATAVARH
eukprot:COSAG02_NODE_268_length_26526_cov_28.495554_2_plen_148_part_00